MKKPTGLGMWVAFNHTALSKYGGDWLGLGSSLKEMGVSWLAPRVGSKGKSETLWNRIGAKRAIEDLHSVGIEVYPWWFSYPHTTSADANGYGYLKDVGADGVIVNAEQHWNGHGATAAKYGELLRKTFGDDYYIAHAPMAGLPYWANWPYKQFGSWVDAVMPQLYWTELMKGDYADMTRRLSMVWEEAYESGDKRAKGFSPIGCTYGSQDWSRTAPGKFSSVDLQRFLNRYQNLDCVSLYSLEAANGDAIAELKARHQRSLIGHQYGVSAPVGWEPPEG